MENEEQARYWNGDEAAHWPVHESRYERTLAPFTDHLLAAAAIGRADRVVDVGCGTGSTTSHPARLMSPEPFRCDVPRRPGGRVQRGRDICPSTDE
jgi:hypothetical protein